MIRVSTWKLLPFLSIFNMLGAPGTLAQGVLMEGYVFESDNGDYLNEVLITLHSKDGSVTKQKTQTNREGYFKVYLPTNASFLLTAEKPLFYVTSQDFSTYHLKDGEKTVQRIQLNHEPGYHFDLRLASEKSNSNWKSTQGISGAHIEIYNNTIEEELLNLHNYPHPNFSFTFQQGNHYTILIRKTGYFAKRLEAVINADGCNLCFDGLTTIESITDDKTVGHKMGDIIAHIELQKADHGTSFEIENIFYDMDRSEIRPDAVLALNKIVGLLKDNHGIKVELGSYTDSRGGSKYNLRLSQRRANAAVDYLVSKGVSPEQITSQGYGESHLVNGCRDGVACKEEAHQENRRTEIKVLDISEENVLHTLRDIKRMEKMEGKIRIVPREEILGVFPISMMPRDLQIIRDSTAGAIEVQSDSKESERQPNIGLHRADSTIGTKVSGRMPIEEQPMVKEQKMTGRTASMDDRIRKESSFLAAMGRPKAQRAHATVLFPNVPENYTGFMVEIEVSEEPITKLDTAMNQFPVIRCERTIDGTYKYLVGAFTKIIDAVDYFDEKIKESYPNARIIEFISGKRL